MSRDQPDTINSAASTEHSHELPREAKQLREVHGWREELRETLRDLLRIYEKLSEHDARLERHLTSLYEAGQNKNGSASFERSQREFERTLKRARKALELTNQMSTNLFLDLEDLKLEASESLTVDRVPEYEDDIDEASWESFPASDPPSFNPGRA